MSERVIDDIPDLEFGDFTRPEENFIYARSEGLDEGKLSLTIIVFTFTYGPCPVFVFSQPTPILAALRFLFPLHNIVVTLGRKWEKICYDMID